MMRRLCAVALLAALGCGSPSEDPKAVVRGKLLDNGKPFAADAVRLRLPKGATLPPGNNPIQIMFIPLDGNGETYIATVTDSAAGAFQLTGSDGKGARLGKYKVSVQINTGPGTPDALAGKFSPEKTTLTCELKAGEEVVLDLHKPKG